MDPHSFQQHNHDQLRKTVDHYLRYKDVEYDRVLKRRRLIESYKESSETQRRERILQQQEEQLKREEQRRAEEIRRLEEQNKENEKKKAQAERVSLFERKLLFVDYRMRYNNARKLTNFVASNRIRCINRSSRNAGKRS